MKKTTELIKDISSLNQMDTDTLNLELNKAKKEHFIMKMKHYSNELKETHNLKPLRKYIARLKTFLAAK